MEIEENHLHLERFSNITKVVFTKVNEVGRDSTRNPIQNKNKQIYGRSNSELTTQISIRITCDLDKLEIQNSFKFVVNSRLMSKVSSIECH